MVRGFLAGNDVVDDGSGVRVMQFVTPTAAAVGVTFATFPTVAIALFFELPPEWSAVPAAARWITTLLEPDLATSWSSVAVLAAWLVGAAAVAVRTFRWEART